MAIAMISTPAQYQTGYNPIIYKVDSTNKNKVGFRYLVNIYDRSDNSLFRTLKISPDIDNNGYGIIDVSRILQDKLDYKIDLTVNSNQNISSNVFKYDIKFGESYIEDWEFDDYEFRAGDKLALTTDGYSNGTHSFQPGDSIYVTMQNNYVDNRKLLNGYFQIESIESDKTIILAIIKFTQIGNFPFPNKGNVIHSDRQRVNNYDLTTVSDRYVYNVAKSNLEYINTGRESIEIYRHTGTNKKLLTNLPDTFKSSRKSNNYLAIPKVSGTKYVYFENSNGDVFRSNGISSTNDETLVSIGPDNLTILTIVTGTLPLIKSDTKWYNVWIDNVSQTQPTNKKNIVIDDRCKINDIDILFMDRKGSFSTFSFSLKYKSSIEVNKEKYSKRNYLDHTTDAGIINYYSEFERKLTLNTNYLSESENIYFEELLTSRVTFIKLDDYWYSCYIEGGQFSTELKQNNKLIRRTINVKLSLNENIN